MHVTFGRVSASRRETTSYQFSQSGAVASNAAQDFGVVEESHTSTSRDSRVFPPHIFPLLLFFFFEFFYLYRFSQSLQSLVLSDLNTALTS